jgi:hypothetical protein
MANYWSTSVLLHQLSTGALGRAAVQHVDACLHYNQSRWRDAPILGVLCFVLLLCQAGGAAPTHLLTHQPVHLCLALLLMADCVFTTAVCM